MNVSNAEGLFSFWIYRTIFRIVNATHAHILWKEKHDIIGGYVNYNQKESTKPLTPDGRKPMNFLHKESEKETGKNINSYATASKLY